jgi:rhodanese-related sulfurtransferase
MENTTVAGMISAARQHIDNLSPDQVQAEAGKEDVVLVDIREPEELATTGVIPGAITAPRGMLEFYADASTPYHRPEFDTDKRMILYCASGGRSALAASALKQLGFDRVAHLDGGIKAWQAAGLPVTNDEAP